MSGKLNLREFETNLINSSGVFVGDYFMLSVCGVMAFFVVASTDKDGVYLCELKKKTDRAAETVELDEGLTPSKAPQVILSGNSMSKTQYRVTPIDIDGQTVLPIELPWSSPLLAEARSCGHDPIVGTYYATKMDVPLQRVWISPDLPLYRQA